MSKIFSPGTKEKLLLYQKTLRSFSRKEKTLSIFLIILILVALIQLIFSGESNGKSALAKGIYSEGMVGQIKWLNPVFADFNEVDQDLSSLIFSGLSKYDPFERKIVEDIAVHTLNEDQLTYTFILKDGVKWHDGTLVTADDIYFTYHDLIQNEDFKNNLLKASFQGVEIEKIDDRTVAFTLKEPNSFFFARLSVGLLPKHILGEVPVGELDQHEFNKKPVGTGPYQVKSAYQTFEDGRTQVDLEVSPDFYGEKPQIKNLRFYTFPDFETLLESQALFHGIARLPHYRLLEVSDERFNRYQYELSQYTALFFNTDSPYLAKTKTRLGIGKAINKQIIIESIGYQKIIDTPFPELNQENWIHQTNPEEAKGALYDAGWHLEYEENGALIRKNIKGEILQLRLVRRAYPGNPRQEEVVQKTAEMIKEQLEEAGVLVEIEAYENEDLQEKIKNRDYDLLLYGQSLGYDLDTYSYWHSSQANEYGLNLSNYRNARADYYIEAIRRTFDPEEKADLLNKLGGIIEADISAVFLYTPTYYFLADQRVKDLEIKNLLFPSDRFTHISDWNF